MEKIRRKVKCPSCGQDSLYAEENPFRPFCSERCQMRDLGAWATEKRFIVGDPVNSPIEVNENSNSSEEEEPRPPRHHLN